MDNQSAIKNRDSKTISIWQEGQKNISQPLSTHENIFDVIIIGGGITGVTTALLLQKAGKKCVLVEAKNIGFGTTGGTTAHINTFFDSDYAQIEKDFGEKTAERVATAGKSALSLIEQLINEYEIDCDFEYKDAYLYTLEEKDNEQLENILKASKRSGIEVHESSTNGIPLNFKKSIRYPKQAQFHPLKYIYKLAEEFQKLGGEIRQHTLIQETTYEKGMHIASSEQVKIQGKSLVYATHIPPTINILHLRCAPYRSYVIGIKLKNDDYPDCLSYELKDNYHYFRTHIQNNQKYLIIGGHDHKTGHGNSEDSFNDLEDFARKNFEVDSIDYKWSSQFYESADGLPYIGKLPGSSEQTYVATGFTGNGMTFGTLSAQIIADLILKESHEYSDIFNPSRIKPIAGFSNFIKENSDVIYHFIADRLNSEDLESLKLLQPNEGLIANYENKKIAIFKNSNGEVAALNPVCTHAGCIVSFNKSEQSWDCPCHGGRYDINGKVLTGPPRKNLQQIKLRKSK